MATETVRASILHGAKDLHIGPLPVDPLTPTDVLITVTHTTLCGSDLHYYHHFRNGDILVREPLVLGHESAGVVAAVGSAVSSLRVGDRVALEVGRPCGECELCVPSGAGGGLGQSGSRYNICRDMSFRSSAKSFPHRQGTLQERVVQGAAWCHLLPEGVGMDMGALAEPLCVAVHAADRAGLGGELGETTAPAGGGPTVVVFGAGAVGLLCAAVCRVRGAKRVVVVDVQADRVNFAVEKGFADGGYAVPLPERKAGAEATVAEKLEAAKALAEKIKGLDVRGQGLGEASTVFECTGTEACLQSAIYATKPGGKIMLIGMGNPIQNLPISAAALREVDLLGVFRYVNSYPRAIEMLASKSPLLPPLQDLVTQKFKGLEAIPQAFEMAGRVKDDEGNLVIKVMIET